MNYLDLFSGIGGFALGAYWAGWKFEKHYFSEIDPWCCRLYQQRFPDAIPLGDITKIDGVQLVTDTASDGQNRCEKFIREEFQEREVRFTSSQWIISGGFPCQDISTAGKGAGITGARSGLWFEYARLIGEIRPRYAIMENVGALTRRGLDRVLGSLAEIGYDAEWSDIRASDVGAPHRRERIWIVAYPHRESESVLPVDAEVAGCMANPSGERCGSWRTESTGQPRKPCASDGREDVADSDNSPASRQRINGGEIYTESESERFDGSRSEGWWSTEPDVGRVAHGIPARVDRLKGLGNSIVPQIAEMIFRQLKENIHE